MDFKFVSKNDIKIVEFSHFPNGTCTRQQKMGCLHSDEVYIEPGVGYVGCKDLKEQGHVVSVRIF